MSQVPCKFPTQIIPNRRYRLAWTTEKNAAPCLKIPVNLKMILVPTSKSTSSPHQMKADVLSFHLIQYHGGLLTPSEGHKWSMYVSGPGFSTVLHFSTAALSTIPNCVASNRRQPKQYCRALNNLIIHLILSGGCPMTCRDAPVIVPMGCQTCGRRAN